MKDPLGGGMAPATDVTIRRGHNSRDAGFLDLSRRALRLRLLTALAFWLPALALGRGDEVAGNDRDVIGCLLAKQSQPIIVTESEAPGAASIPKESAESVATDAPDVEIVLIEGDIVRGRLLKEEKYRVFVMHPDLGRMAISKDRVKSLKIEGAEVTVVLTDGETIEGKFIERNDSAIILEDPNDGRVEIPNERVDSFEIKTPGFKSTARAGFFDDELRWFAHRTSRLGKRGWSAALDLSFNSSQGNTDEQTMRIGGSLRRVLDDMRAGADLSYYYKMSDDEVTDNKLTIGALRDWLYPESKWFCFVSGRFDYDEFESWEKRANVQAGPGYHLVETDYVRLDGRLGMGVRREWGSEQDNVEAEAAIGADLEWDINDRQTLTFKPYLFPVVDQFNDYRSRVTAEWRLAFTEDLRLSLLAGTLYEYQSIVDPGKTHSDLRWYLGLQFAF